MHAKANERAELSLTLQLRAILTSCWWFGALLVLIPVGFALNYAKIHGVASFVVNITAMIPLAGMLGFAAEQLSYYLGEVLGGLLVATFA
jgi:Ca2+:H+ antiporter